MVLPELCQKFAKAPPTLHQRYILALPDISNGPEALFQAFKDLEKS